MYLDPSFGGMLIQILVAVVAGSGAILFGMRRKILAFFKKGKSDTPVNINRQSQADGEIVDMLSDDSNNK
jgi:hypothetical protein